jgi:hypothetical protein
MPNPSNGWAFLLDVGECTVMRRARTLKRFVGLVNVAGSVCSITGITLLYFREKVSITAPEAIVMGLVFSMALLALVTLQIWYYLYLRSTEKIRGLLFVSLSLVYFAAMLLMDFGAGSFAFLVVVSLYQNHMPWF